jgi:hypothetical protein
MNGLPTARVPLTYGFREAAETGAKVRFTDQYVIEGLGASTGECGAGA